MARERIDEARFEEILADALESYDDEELSDLAATPFGELGFLTRDRGLVVTIGDAEFQITIVRRR